MFGFVGRRLVIPLISPNSYRPAAAIALDLCLNWGFYHHNASSLLVSAKSLATEIESSKQQESSFTVSYLVNSCGLSPEKAKCVSQKVKLKSVEKPDAVLKLLKSFGFSDAHITKLVRIRPTILTANPEKSILPKFEFFKSIGVTEAELADVCSTSPSILSGSLDNQIVPNYKYLKSFLVSDENVIRAFRKKSWVFQQDSERRLSPKLAVFKQLGVPESRFSLIVMCYSSSILLQRSSNFDKNVKKAIELGFSPKRWKFIQALHALSSVSEANWERKLDIFRRWGWSDDDCSTAFKNYPGYLCLSESNIETKLDFLVNKMGWKSTDLVTYPAILALNLEKRIIPRCLILEVLQSKGLYNGSARHPVIKLNDAQFLERFVRKHTDIVPQLLSIFQGKKNLQI